MLYRETLVLYCGNHTEHSNMQCADKVGKILLLKVQVPIAGGTAVAQWLRFCATNRKVAGSIPNGVIGFFR
jgi:hypothetical protein